MNGLGFMIWQFANMPQPEELSSMLALAGVRWVSIKVLDGPNLYNAKGGNQKLLKAYWAALEDRKIEVGGWQYVYGDQPGLEGDAAIAFYEEFHPAHFLIDAEGEYKRYGAAKAAKTYCSKLHNGQVEVLLCSYRFPSLHRPLIKPFPFSAFMNHEKVDGAAPQVYWIGAHDPVTQIGRSLAEYQDLSNKSFVPIGSSFSTGTWEPTVEDFKNFIAGCRYYELNAYGFYSLDFILKNNRKDWFAAITGQAPEPPPPGPTQVIDIENASIRSSPEQTAGTLFAKGILGARVKVIGDPVNDYYPIQAYIWKEALEK